MVVSVVDAEAQAARLNETQQLAYLQLAKQQLKNAGIIFKSPDIDVHAFLGTKKSAEHTNKLDIEQFFVDATVTTQGEKTKLLEQARATLAAKQQVLVRLEQVIAQGQAVVDATADVKTRLQNIKRVQAKTQVDGEEQASADDAMRGIMTDAQLEQLKVSRDSYRGILAAQQEILVKLSAEYTDVQELRAALSNTEGDNQGTETSSKSSHSSYGELDSQIDIYHETKNAVDAINAAVASISAKDAVKQWDSTCHGLQDIIDSTYALASSTAGTLDWAGERATQITSGKFSFTLKPQLSKQASGVDIVAAVDASLELAERLYVGKKKKETGFDTAVTAYLDKVKQAESLTSVDTDVEERLGKATAIYEAWDQAAILALKLTTLATKHSFVLPGTLDLTLAANKLQEAKQALSALVDEANVTIAEVQQRLDEVNQQLAVEFTLDDADAETTLLQSKIALLQEIQALGLLQASPQAVLGNADAITKINATLNDLDTEEDAARQRIIAIDLQLVGQRQEELMQQLVQNHRAIEAEDSIEGKRDLLLERMDILEEGLRLAGRKGDLLGALPQAEEAQVTAMLEGRALLEAGMTKAEQRIIDLDVLVFNEAIAAQQQLVEANDDAVVDQAEGIAAKTEVIKRRIDALAEQQNLNEQKIDFLAQSGREIASTLRNANQALVDATAAAIDKLHAVQLQDMEQKIVAQEQVVAAYDDTAVDQAQDLEVKTRLISARVEAIAQLQTLNKQKIALLAQFGKTPELTAQDVDNSAATATAAAYEKLQKVQLQDEGVSVSAKQAEIEQALLQTQYDATTPLAEQIDALRTRVELTIQLLDINQQQMYLATRGDDKYLDVDAMVGYTEKSVQLKQTLAECKQLLMNALAQQAQAIVGQEYVSDPELRTESQLVLNMRDTVTRMQDIQAIYREAANLGNEIAEFNQGFVVVPEEFNAFDEDPLTVIMRSLEELHERNEDHKSQVMLGTVLQLTPYAMQSSKAVSPLASLFSREEAPVATQDVTTAIAYYANTQLRLQAALAMQESERVQVGVGVATGNATAHRMQLEKEVATAQRQLVSAAHALQSRIAQKDRDLQVTQGFAVGSSHDGIETVDARVFFGNAANTGQGFIALNLLEHSGVTLAEQSKVSEAAAKAAVALQGLNQEAAATVLESLGSYAAFEPETLRTEQTTLKQRLTALLNYAARLDSHVKTMAEQQAEQHVVAMGSVTQTQQAIYDSLLEKTALLRARSVAAAPQADRVSAQLSTAQDETYTAFVGAEVNLFDVARASLEGDTVSSAPITAVRNALMQAETRLHGLDQQALTEAQELAQQQQTVVQRIALAAQHYSVMAKATLADLAASGALSMERIEQVENCYAQLQDLQQTARTLAKSTQSFADKVAALQGKINEMGDALSAIAEEQPLAAEERFGRSFTPAAPVQARRQTPASLAQKHKFLQTWVERTDQDTAILPAIKHDVLGKLAQRQAQNHATEAALHTMQLQQQQSSLVEAQAVYVTAKRKLQDEIDKLIEGEIKTQAKALLAQAEELYAEGRAPLALTVHLHESVAATGRFLDINVLSVEHKYSDFMTMASKAQGHADPRMQKIGVGMATLGVAVLVTGLALSLPAVVVAAAGIGIVAGLFKYFGAREHGMAREMRKLETLDKKLPLQPTRTEQVLDAVTDATVSVTAQAPVILAKARVAAAAGKENLHEQLAVLAERASVLRAAASRRSDELQVRCQDQTAALRRSLREKWDNTQDTRDDLRERAQNTWSSTQPARTWVSDTARSTWAATEPARSTVSGRVGDFAESVQGAYAHCRDQVQEWGHDVSRRWNYGSQAVEIEMLSMQELSDREDWPELTTNQSHSGDHQYTVLGDPYVVPQTDDKEWYDVLQSQQPKANTWQKLANTHEGSSERATRWGANPPSMMEEIDLTDDPQNLVSSTQPRSPFAVVL